MTQLLQWDAVGEKLFETGVDHGVLYPMDVNGAYPKGVAWNGLSAITENPSGAEPNPIYADNLKYLNLMSAEEFGANIEAYTYPDEFAVCEGSLSPVVGLNVSQQTRKTFGLCYRTKVGNDVEGENLGYKLHLVYGALAAPSDRGYQTVTNTPEAISFSWDITTTPVELVGYKPTASLVIDSTKVSALKLSALEVILYGATGTPNVDARLPLPAAIVTLLTP